MFKLLKINQKQRAQYALFTQVACRGCGCHTPRVRVLAEEEGTQKFVFVEKPGIGVLHGEMFDLMKSLPYVQETTSHQAAGKEIHEFYLGNVCQQCGLKHTEFDVFVRFPDLVNTVFGEVMHLDAPSLDFFVDEFDESFLTDMAEPGVAAMAS